MFRIFTFEHNCGCAWQGRQVDVRVSVDTDNGVYSLIEPRCVEKDTVLELIAS